MAVDFDQSQTNYSPSDLTLIIKCCTLKGGGDIVNKNKYNYLLLLVITTFMTTYINAEVDLFLAILFFIYTSIPSLILYNLFYIKKIKPNLRLVLGPTSIFWTQIS